MGSGRGVPHFAGGEDDSEDDRPEEVSLEAAKSDVQKRQSDENAAKRKLASQAKAVRRRQSQRKEDDDTAPPSLLVGSAAKQGRTEKSRKRKSEGAVDASEPAEVRSSDAGAAADELLPDAVLAELAEKERLENIQRASEAHRPEARVKTKRKQPAKTAKTKLRSDGVQVVVLDSGTSVAGSASQGATEFQKERLFGANRKRSHSMLAGPYQLERSFT